MSGSGARLEISLDIDRADDVLARVIGAASDLTPALKNIGEYGAQSTKDRIVAEVTPEGKPFAPLNPAYAETKKGPGILRGATGDLAAIVWQLAGQDAVEWGNNAPHGAAHQFGVVIKPKNAAALIFSLGGRTVFASEVTIPARPYLGVSAEDEAEILGIVADHFQQATGGELDAE